MLLLLWMLLGFPDLDAERYFSQFPNVEIFWSVFVFEIFWSVSDC